MPTTNLPSESVSSVSSDTIILLRTRTSNNNETLVAGAEHFIDSAYRLNLLATYDWLQFSVSGFINVIYNMVEGVDYKFKTTGYDLVEGVDYEIEYNDAVNIPFWIETGSPFRNQERGEMSGYNAVKRRNAYSDFAVTTEARGLKVFLPRVVPIPVSINTNPVVHTRVRSGSTTINMSLPSISHMGKSVIQKGYAQIGISMLVTASGKSAIKVGYASMDMSMSTIVQGQTLFKKGTTSISFAMGLSNVPFSTTIAPLGYFEVVGGTEAPSDIKLDPYSSRSGSGNLSTSKLFQKYKSILAGKTFDDSASTGDYVGSGSHLQLTHSSSFDQNNFVIAGWIGLQVSSDIKDLNTNATNAIHFDWSPWKPNGVTENGVSIAKTSDFEFRLTGDNSSSAYVPQIIHGDNTIDITNPDTSSAYPNQPTFEALLKNTFAQFYAIRVTTEYPGIQWTSGSQLSQQYPYGRKVIQWKVGTDNPSISSSSLDGNTYYEGGGERVYALTDQSTPLGNTNYLRLGDGGLFPYEATQLMLWKDVGWASSTLFGQVATEIRQYGMGADLATYSRNWYDSINIPTFSGYWRMGDHGGYDTSGVRTFDYGGTSQNAPIGTLDNTLNQHLYPNEM